MDDSLPGSSIHRVLQAGILDRVAIPFPRGSSRPRDRTRVSLFKKKIFIFNWLMIALQYWLDFCHTWTCINLRWACVPSSWSSLPPPAHCHPSGLLQSPGLSSRSCSRLPLAGCLHVAMYVSMPPSPFASPPPLPATLVPKPVLYVCVSWTCVSCVSCIGRWALYHQHHLENLRDNKTITFSLV